jgi:ASC-1-like (ASCH) protein
MILVLAAAARNSNSAMENRIIHNLPFLEENRNTFNLIKEGKKTIETRAGCPQYLKIDEGDIIEFSCGDDKIFKQVKKILHYKNLEELFAVYQPQDIDPEVSSYSEMRKRYLGFPDYEQRINKYGILVFELENKT